MNFNFRYDNQNREINFLFIINRKINYKQAKLIILMFFEFL